jgi:hypothetical protein
MFSGCVRQICYVREWLTMAHQPGRLCMGGARRASRSVPVISSAHIRGGTAALWCLPPTRGVRRNAVARNRGQITLQKWRARG